MPVLRFNEFEGEFEMKKLGNIASFLKGKGISKSDISKSGIDCIRYGELYTKYGEVINDTISKTEIDIDDLVLSQANDVIIPASGETSIDIATASCVMNTGIALGGDLNIIRTKINGVFLSYYLNNSLKLKIARLAQGVSVVHLYSRQLKTLKLNLPTKPEQQKIANFLTATDTKIQQLRQKKGLLNDYKKGVMQQIFKQEIRFKNDDGGDFEDWEVKKLGEVLISRNEKTLKSNQHEILSSTTRGLFLQSEYFTRDIASKDNTGYKILRKNQLVFSPQNIWMGNININRKYEIGIVSPSYKIFSFSNDVCVLFLNDFLKIPKMIHEYAQVSEQGASIVRRNLNVELFLDIKVKLPQLEEQQKIANFLSSIDERIGKVSVEIGEMERYKKGLLQGMFV